MRGLMLYAMDTMGLADAVPASNTLDQPGLDPGKYPIILPFHTVHGVLKARILKWFAIPFSSGPHPVRSLLHDPPILGCPMGMA